MGKVPTLQKGWIGSPPPVYHDLVSWYLLTFSICLESLNSLPLNSLLTWKQRCSVSRSPSNCGERWPENASEPRVSLAIGWEPAKDGVLLPWLRNTVEFQRPGGPARCLIAVLSCSIYSELGTEVLVSQEPGPDGRTGLWLRGIEHNRSRHVLLS